jgi:Big-like domain-containing protein
MKSAILALFVAASLVSGCGAVGALAGLGSLPKPTPTPSLIVTPSSLTMHTSGPLQNQTLTASESGSAFFSAQSTDVTIATVIPVQNQTNAFTVTAVKAGKCNINVSDGNGQTVAVPINVTQ